MRKEEPVMFVNFAVKDEQFEEKVKLAMEKYAENVVHKELDEIIQKIVEQRINNLISGGKWAYGKDNQIGGMSFTDFVKNKTEKVIEETIEKNIKEVFAKKVAEML